VGLEVHRLGRKRVLLMDDTLRYHVTSSFQSLCQCVFRWQGRWPSVGERLEVQVMDTRVLGYEQPRFTDSVQTLRRRF